MKYLYAAMCLCVSVSAYASCQPITINTPTGTTVCTVCNDGKIINCMPL